MSLDHQRWSLVVGPFVAPAIRYIGGCLQVGLSTFRQARLPAGAPPSVVTTIFFDGLVDADEAVRLAERDLQVVIQRGGDR